MLCRCVMIAKNDNVKGDQDSSIAVYDADICDLPRLKRYIWAYFGQPFFSTPIVHESLCLNVGIPGLFLIPIEMIITHRNHVSIKERQVYWVQEGRLVVNLAGTLSVFNRSDVFRRVIKLRNKTSCLSFTPVTVDRSAVGTPRISGCGTDAFRQYRDYFSIINLIARCHFFQ